jgi:hypothetical protein
VATPDKADDASGLDARARSILAFEREWWRYAGAKEQAIRDHFAMSPTTYYRTLSDLIDSEAALAYDAMLVKRLRRMRAQRQRQRAQARLNARVQ